MFQLKFWIEVLVRVEIIFDGFPLHVLVTASEIIFIKAGFKTRGGVHLPLPPVDKEPHYFNGMFSKLKNNRFE